MNNQFISNSRSKYAIASLVFLALAGINVILVLLGTYKNKAPIALFGATPLFLLISLFSGIFGLKSKRRSISELGIWCSAVGLFALICYFLLLLRAFSDLI